MVLEKKWFNNEIDDKDDNDEDEDDDADGRRIIPIAVG